MTAEQWMQPPVNAPVRKQHRSRTPARERQQKQLGTTAPTAALPDLPESLALAPATPHVSHPSRAETSAPAPRLQADGSEVIDVDNLPDIPQPAAHLELIAPSTPPDLVSERRPPSKRGSAEPISEQSQPAPPGYGALTAKNTRQLRITNHTFHLKGYNRIAKAATPAGQGLQVWARLDTAANSLKTTRLSGPPKGHIRRRRVLTYPDGRVVWDKPYDNSDDDRTISPEYTALVTELWREPFHQNSSLGVTPEGIQQRPLHSDGSEDIGMPHACHVALKAYRKTKDYKGTGESSDSEAQDSRRKLWTKRSHGKPSSRRALTRSNASSSQQRQKKPAGNSSTRYCR